MILPTDSVVAPFEPRGLPLPLGFPLRLPATARHPQPLTGTSATMARGGSEVEHIVGGTDQRSLFLDLPQPCNKNWRKPRPCLICPKTGSTMPFRLAYWAWSRLVRNVQREQTKGESLCADQQR
jgi:hypothetical protein